MNTIRTTDYLGAIPFAPLVGFLVPDLRPGTELLLKLPKLATPMPTSGQGFHQRVAADFSLIALVATAATMVAIVFLNWSR
jgi:hypothetical protein